MRSIIPHGNSVAEIQCPFHELLRFTDDLNVGVKVNQDGGEGYILIEKGSPLAAYFTKDFRWYTGLRALNYFRRVPLLSCDIIAYAPESLDHAKKYAQSKGWDIKHESSHSQNTNLDILNDEKLSIIANQPGVVAVSAFFDGFPVYTIGNADFERVAAIAEDLLRSGREIAEDLDIGYLEQINLETDDGKFMIAPVGDLFLCVQTAPNAHLGLIRLAIRGIQ